MILLYAVVFVLPAGLYTLLRSPWVQNYISHRVSEYLSSELGTKVSVGGVNIAFFLDVVLEDVDVRDKNDSTLLSAKYIIADIGNIEKSAHRLFLDRVTLDSAYFALRKNPDNDQVNLQFIIDYFSSGETTKSPPSKPWTIVISSLELINTRFIYNDPEFPHPAGGMDYGYLDISGINLFADNISINSDTINASIRNLSARDRCGFTLKSFSADATVSPHELTLRKLKITTPNSVLSLDFQFAYDGWGAYLDFMNKVKITAEISESKLNIKDIGYFAPVLSVMNEQFGISGKLKGYVAKTLSARDFKILYGSSTYFEGNISLNGLPDIEHTHIKTHIKKFTTVYNDIAALDLPGTGGTAFHVAIPQELVELGNVQISGDFEGFYSDFNANANMRSSLGNATANLKMWSDSEHGLNNYKGKITSDGFQLGTLLRATDVLGSISIDADIEGSGFTKETADLHVNGKVSSFDLKNYQYHNIDVNGEFSQKIFNGLLTVADENLAMDFKGSVDMNDSIPIYNFISTIKKARLDQIHLVSSDSVSDVSGTISAYFQGSTIDDLTGFINVQNASYRDGSQYYKLDYLNVTARSGFENERTFYLKSDYMDAEFKGVFYFAGIASSVKRYITSYLPGISFKSDSLKDSVYKQDFTFDITFYNATPVLKYFIHNAEVSPNTRLKGNFSSLKNTFNFDFNSSLFTFNHTRFHDIYCSAVTRQNRIDFTSGCGKIVISDSAFFENTGVIAKITNDSIKYMLVYDNKQKTKHNAATIGGYMTFEESGTVNLQIDPSYVVVDDTTWNIKMDRIASVDSSGIFIPGMTLTSNKQQLHAEGKISKSAKDKLSLDFINFNISDFDFLTNKEGFDLDGIINGKAEIYALLDKPTFFTDIHIDDFAFNSTMLGAASIRSNWDDLSSGIRIDAEVLYVGSQGTSKPVQIDGYYYPRNPKNNFDLNILVENFQLKSLSRYIAGTATLYSGTATGNCTLKGPASDPELNGKLKLMKTRFRIDYLNTTYAFAYDNLRVDKNGFYFDQLALLDQPGNTVFDTSHIKTTKFTLDTALCNGRITHRNFKDWKFDIELFPKKFLCLNTGPAQNDLFYGKAYATGYAHIRGDEKNVSIEIDAKTERNTQLFIPLNNSSTISENKYIVFINKEGQFNTEGHGDDLSGISLSCKFQVTDDAEVQILFDPAVGDRIRGRGNGNLTMEISNSGKFSMSGDYTIKSGDYLFTFENVLNKRFDLVEGGTISWTGDPYNAELDLKAIYHLKSSLISLGIDTNKNSVPVDCIINMSGPLEKPDFDFEVDLPSMNEFEKGPYMQAINQNLNYNFLTLLVVNSFYNSGIVAGNNAQLAGNAAGRTSSEVLSNQMSNWLSQISKKVDIGINYRPGDQITEQEVAVALSTQLFNDRIRIETNVGVGGGQANSQTHDASNIVGDVNLEVKLTDKTKLRVFNKSNQVDNLVHNAPYTQGVGVFYKREFNTFGELFKRKKKKKP